MLAKPDEKDDASTAKLPIAKEVAAALLATAVAAVAAPVVAVVVVAAVADHKGPSWTSAMPAMRRARAMICKPASRWPSTVTKNMAVKAVLDCDKSEYVAASKWRRAVKYSTF